jgi:hypothetical protein
MANYMFDLGFDYASPSTSASPTTLKIGLVSFQPPPPAPASANRFQQGDTVGFNVFNLTSGAPMSGYSIAGGQITFSAGPNQTIDTPLLQQTGGGSAGLLNPVVINPLPAPTGSGQSAIFSTGNMANQNFPVFFVAGPLTMQNIGIFKVSVSLNVQGPDGTQQSFQSTPFQFDVII